MAVNIKEDGATTLVVPTVILGLDMTKFLQPKLELNANETFDENLKRLFGITADQAAEIINYSEISDMTIANEPVAVGGRRGQKGGVNAASLVGAIASAVAMMQNVNTAVNYVVDAVGYVDKVSGAFVEGSKLRKTAELWRRDKNLHCPNATTVPVACSFWDLKCKAMDYVETGEAIGQYEYNAELCELATKRYAAAYGALPAADRVALEAFGAGVQGVINIVNKAQLSTTDFEALKKAKLIDDDGKVLNDVGMAKYFADKKTKANTTQTNKTDDSGSASPSPEAAPAAEAPRGRRGKKAEAPEDVAAPEDPAITAAVAAAKKEADDRAAAEAASAGPRSSRGRRPSGEGGLRKTKKSNTKRRVTRRKVPARLKFVY